MRKVIFFVVVIAVSVWVASTLTSNRELAAGSALARDGTAAAITATADAPITIVHFWGSWCGPCRHELPSFAGFKAEYEPKGVGFVIVADDPDFATVDRFLRENDIRLDPILLDTQGAAGRDWGVSVYPTTFVLSPTNEILAVYRGTIDWTSPLQRREILRLGGVEP